jgi:hypothetical protein
MLVTGTWEFTDTIRYGPETGSSYLFRITLSQQGALVRGSSDAFTLTGVLNGRTLLATYGEATGNQFAWTFSADGESFSGTYTNIVGNGGDSVGRRASR